MSETPTPSEPWPAASGELTAAQLRRERGRLLADDSLSATALRAALGALTDRWLEQLFRAALSAPSGATGQRAPARQVQLPDPAPDDVDGLALVAVGGYGRCELAPFSDLDLVLLHDAGNGSRRLSASHRRGPSVTDIAERIWYPIWDARLRLDHSVRTPAEVVQIADQDLKAQLGLLDLRHVAGDAGLSARVRANVLDRWSTSASRRVGELAAAASARWAMTGDAAFLLEPDLKDSRGGLRDVGLLRALALAQLVDFPEPTRLDNRRLLDVRTELQRRTGTDSDVLRLQEQAPVARALGLPGDDAVLRLVNEAARRVAHTLDGAFRRVGTPRVPPRTGVRRMWGRGGSATPERIPLARDVVEQDGEVVLARDADPWADPVLLLRAARVAAERDVPLSPFTLERLATEARPLPCPWPRAALTEFVTLLGAGRSAIPVVESLDLAGLFDHLLPEWASVRYKAQHNPVHRFTVDRHLLETAAEAAALQREVDRPDLLLLGALLHDIGKGGVGDHSITGAVIARPILERMGLPPADVDIVVALVRHHLLLPDTATRRDLDDPVTVAGVAAAIDDSRTVLDLLHSLAIADAAATGPAAWSHWKANLVANLVARTAALLRGQPIPGPPELPEQLAQLVTDGRLAMVITDGDLNQGSAELVVAAPDQPGLLSRTAGVLALHSLDVRSAAIRTVAAMAVNTFVVTSRFGSVPELAVMRSDLERALVGTLPLAQRLQAKERSYAPGSSPQPTAAHQQPAFRWLDNAASDATVLEVRTDDAIGLLHRLTAALERLGLDIRSARVSSLGRAVVDVFYLTTRDGAPVPAEQREPVSLALREATAASL